MDRLLSHMPARCIGCQSSLLDFGFTMAFQPIVDISTRSVFAYEALVRGLDSAPALSILARVDHRNRYAFDQECRAKAIRLAAALGMQARLSVNLLPNAIYQPEACIQRTLETAAEVGFDTEQIIFELTENEQSHNLPHLKNVFDVYRRLGFTTAIDDFGAGYATFDVLAEFQPDVVKIDMALIRGIEASAAKQVIVGGIVEICHKLGVRTLGEGIETAGELAVLKSLGINLFQGYLFARPAINQLPAIDWSRAAI